MPSDPPGGYPLTPDQNAALDGAAAPSAENPFATMADAGGGGAEVIGPFAIAYNTAGITNDDDSPYGAFVGPVLPSGTIVLDAWIAVATTFDGGSAPYATIVAEDSDDPDAGTAGFFSFGSALSAATAHPSPTPSIGIIPTDAHDWKLLVWLNLTDPTQGAASVYALVQYP